MDLTGLLILVLFIFALSKCWRYFLELSEDLRLIRLLEPWYWCVFLNLLLFPITSNYDYQFELVGLLIQLALSAWFAISIGWIIQGCHHKVAISHHSWFVKGKTVKFCYRCGTRLSKDSHADLVHDRSWQSVFFQVPPHLLNYVVFWTIQSAMALILLFFVLRFLKDPSLQHLVVWIVAILVILAPPAIYSLGRFRKYVSRNKGLIWWEDIQNSVLVWAAVLLILGALIKWL